MEGMMVSSNYWLCVSAILVASLLVLKVAILLWWRPRKMEEHFAKQGIRGPPYRFFIGNFKEIVSLMGKAASQPMTHSHNILPRVLSFYHHWKKIYGGTFLLWFGPTARLTVADPDLIREIFVSKSELYERYESHPLVRQLEGGGLLSLKLGKKWAYHRKIIGPAFHSENLKLLVPVIGNTVANMADELSAAMSPAGEVEVDVSEWFQTLTEDVISRTAFGSSHEQGKAVFQLQSQQMIFAAEAFRRILVPGYSYMPTSNNVKSWKLEREVRAAVGQLIERRRQEDQGRRGEGEAKDMLGLMVEAARSTEESTMMMMTEEDMVEECKTFFFAGKHTTSNLLTWTTVLLAMHPHWQDLARSELLATCGPHQPPSKDQLPSLKTLGMILNESLRLYPPVVATIRRPKCDVELGGFGGYRIPRGTELLVPILAVHHDQNLWGRDAAEFNPGRFADGVARAARHPLAFIPFGLGVRTCIGQNLALLQAKLAIAVLLQRFSFELSPAYRHAPTVLMLLYPQHGAPVIFRRRHSTAPNTTGSGLDLGSGQ